MHGGGYYPITEAPYLALLNIHSVMGAEFCGAAILSELWLLTAAHCVLRNNTLSQVTVYLGTSTSPYKSLGINVTEIIVHEKYREQPKAFDIGLIKVAERIEFTEYFYPLPITHASPRPGDVVILAGYGYGHYREFGEALKMMRLRVIEDEVCRRNYTIGPTQFCTDVRDADLCGGDSGAPAVLNDEIVGVAYEGCEYDAPNVFTKVAEFYDWTLDKTGISYGWRKRRSPTRKTGERRT
ncbi:transmembrane protease serine 11A-like isoform X3 [Copidosoma floridanum]|nr:transmembrane protease serine 11A-like isoform X3 [Copidosoma floridanum]